MALPRILVVDDDPGQLVLLAQALAGAGYAVDTAVASAEARRLLAATAFDLVLLDVVLDEMDGFELCRWIKADPRTRHLPVILVTGERASLQMRLKGFEAGAVDYLLKPVQREEVAARARVMLALKGAQDELRVLAGSLQEKVRERTARLEEALEALRGQKALTEEILKSVPLALLVADGQGRVLTWNREFEAAFGPPGPGTELAGHPLLAPLAAFLAAGRPDENRLTLRVASGQARSFWVEATPLRLLPAGGEGGRVISLTDLTDREVAVAALRGREPADLLAEMAELRRELSGRYSLRDMVGFSPGMQEVTRMVDTLRHGRCTVLIQGESGTGKELVARALHFDGPNAARPFIPIHCGAIARDLIESELFGHEKGAFTGAVLRKQGLFKAADGGTLFLDEVGEIPLASQVKLLRVLQEGAFMPIGSNETVRVDVRILAATNKVLAEEVRKGAFREDLFYRLNVVCLEIPPLRARSGDIPCLIDHFLHKYNAIYRRQGRGVRAVSREALAILGSYAWPGNVRELENAFVRAFELGCGEVIQVGDLAPYLVEAFRTGRPGRGEARAVEIPRRQGGLRGYERQALLDAMARAGGDKARAARSLGIGKSTLYRKLKEHEIG